GRAYTTEPVELILAGVALALGELFGAARATVDFESHGRADLPRPIPLERTVGWLTAIHPLLVPTGPGIGEAVLGAKEALRRVPHAGVGYGALAEAGRLVRRPARVCFNYFGVDRPDIGVSPLPAGSDITMENPADYTVLVTARVTEDQLRLTVDWAGEPDDRLAAERLAAAVRDKVKAVVEHCVAQAETVRTISDFDAGLDAVDLDRLNQLVEGL
ncbi:MAG: condensation domain-containing protein, partial [Propionibacteriaceae bacterium]|nr:condensation domain-containing protein [Propionibacteriaceae bacterium]